MSDIKNERIKSTFDLTSFKRAQERMIATNKGAWDPPYTSHRFTEKLRDYKPEEIEKIVA